MIEFELKLQVDNFPKLDKAVFVNEKKVYDVYYDTNEFTLLSTGNFLRNRNNKKVDFKLNIGDLSHTYCKETSFNYENFVPTDSLEKIFKAIGMNYNAEFNGFDDFLLKNGLSTLAVIDKHREEYQFEDLKICFDRAKDIGNFIEIEYQLPDDAVFDKDQIKTYILNKMKNNALVNDYKFVNIGYVELYLKKHNPNAYKLGLFQD